MSTTARPILLYDIPSVIPGCAWSPNVWKTRFCLNYKGLAHKTVWIEYPDIASTYKSLNISPSFFKRTTGEPIYTVPFIIDPATGAAISDSWAIAKYLDATYPDTPRVIPEGTYTFQRAYMYGWDDSTWDGCARFVTAQTYTILNPPSKAFFKETRERSFGMSMEDLMPRGDESRELWSAYEVGLGKVAKWYLETDVWAMGTAPSFADFVAGCEIMWVRLLWGEDSDKWNMVSAWNDGRWGKLDNALRPYSQVY